jgi:heme-degrading monooxygenase HmoA
LWWAVEGLAREHEIGRQNMIVRKWRATADNERSYLDHFRRQVLPGLRSIDGFEGALVLRHAAEQQIEIEVLTFWRSMYAIQKFAGRDAERAVVENEAKAALRSYARRVHHFELALDARPVSQKRNPKKRTES